MEKRNPTFSLSAIQTEFCTVEKLRLSRTARQDSVKLKIELEEIIEIIQSLTKKNFYKSMTTHANHTIWQDVYHAKFRELELYVKFMMDSEGHLLISFKER